MNAGTVHEACSAPGESMPRNFSLRPMWLNPRSAGVSPRVSSGRTTTASPTRKPATSLPDLGDRARHLVADHLRGMHAGVHRTVGDVEVGPADAAVGDVEPHFVGARLLNDALADREAAAAVVVDRVHRTII